MEAEKEMKDSLLLFTVYQDKFKRLNDSQFGRLIRDLMAYQSDGVIPTYDDLALSMAFDVMRADVDAVNARYDAKCAKMRENGSKGGRPKKDENQSVLEKPNGFEENQKNQMVFKKANEPNATYKDKDKEKDKDNELNTHVFNIGGAREEMLKAFRTFWEKYPRKEKEDAACRTWISLKPDAALVDTIMDALATNIAKNGSWKRDGGRYIPTAENWLLERRWKDEVKEEKADKKKNQFNDFEQRTYTASDYTELERRKRLQGLG